MISSRAISKFLYLFLFIGFLLPFSADSAPPATWDTNYRTAAMTEGVNDDYWIVWKGEYDVSQNVTYCVGIVKYKTRALNDQGTAITEDWAFGYYATYKDGVEVDDCDDIDSPERSGILYLHGNFGRGSFQSSIDHAKAVDVPDKYPFSFSISAPGQGPKCDSQECETCTTNQECITYFGNNAGECRDDCCCFSCSSDSECVSEFGADWKCGDGCCYDNDYFDYESFYNYYYCDTQNHPDNYKDDNIVVPPIECCKPWDEDSQKFDQDSLGHPQGQWPSRPYGDPEVFLYGFPGPNPDYEFSMLWGYAMSGMRAVNLFDKAFDRSNKEWTNDNLVVMGSSVGGVTTLLVNGNDDRPTGAIVENATGNQSFAAELPGNWWALGRIAEQYFGGDYDPTYSYDCGSPSNDAETRACEMYSYFEPTSYTPLNPLFIVSGAQDEVFPAPSFQETVDDLRNRPSAEEVHRYLIPDFDHAFYGLGTLLSLAGVDSYEAFSNYVLWGGWRHNDSIRAYFQRLVEPSPTPNVEDFFPMESIVESVTTSGNPIDKYIITGCVWEGDADWEPVRVGFAITIDDFYHVLPACRGQIYSYQPKDDGNPLTIPRFIITGNMESHYDYNDEDATTPGECVDVDTGSIPYDYDYNQKCENGPSYLPVFYRPFSAVPVEQGSCDAGFVEKQFEVHFVDNAPLPDTFAAWLEVMYKVDIGEEDYQSNPKLTQVWVTSSYEQRDGESPIEPCVRPREEPDWPDWWPGQIDKLESAFGALFKPGQDTESLTITSAVTVEAGDVLDYTGYDVTIGTGGSITFDGPGVLITNGDLTINQGRSISANQSSAEDPLGNITIIANNIQISGSVSAIGLNSGATIEIIALGNLNVPSTGDSPAVDADCSSNGCKGGAVVLSAGGSQTISRSIDVSGKSQGGSLEIISAPDGVTVSGAIYAEASSTGGTGGLVEINVAGDIDISSNIYVKSKDEAGQISMLSEGDITISGTLDAQGYDVAGAEGGLITLHGLRNLEVSGTLDSQGVGQGGVIIIDFKQHSDFLNGALIRAKSTGFWGYGGTIDIKTSFELTTGATAEFRAGSTIWFRRGSIDLTYCEKDIHDETYFYPTAGETEYCPFEMEEGNITTNTTWTTANSPYVIVDDVHVTCGTLSIQPGVEVYFMPGKSLYFEAGGICGGGSGGALSADASSGDPIVFTSFEAYPETGDWGVIGFMSTAGSSVLENAIIQYGGNSAKGMSVQVLNDNTDIDDIEIGFSGSVGIYYNDALVNLDGSWIHHCEDSAVKVYEVPTNSEVYGCLIENSKIGVEITGASDLEIDSCEIYGNWEIGIDINGSLVDVHDSDIIGNSYEGTTITIGQTIYDMAVGILVRANADDGAVLDGNNAIYGNMPGNPDLDDEYELINLSEYYVDAEHNWWNSTSRPEIDGWIYDNEESGGSSGIVDFRPFLEEAP